jgi:hypothetical protein
MNRLSVYLSVAAFATLPSDAQDNAHLALDSPFASYVEADFPFFTQTVDARGFGKTPQKQNLTPRGIVVAAGNGVFGCFDPDLLRWSLIWRASDKGEFLTMNGMGTGSYRLPNRKSPPGQKDLPKPLGSPLLAMPLSPGVSTGKTALLHDPRDRGRAEPDETGLGPLPASLGRFSGIRLTGDGARLEYSVGATRVSERFMADEAGVQRWIEAGPRSEKLCLRTGPGDKDWLVLAPSKEFTRHRVRIGPDGVVAVEEAAGLPEMPLPARRWTSAVTVEKIIPPAKDGPWVFDDIPLPLPNPWKRNVRPADLDFLPDGRAAVVSFDGDVWMVDKPGKDRASWSRFASGLHEPQSLCIVDGVVHVFDRNGIVKLLDTDGDGEADWYENFSSVVAQSAETRNYPLDMVAARDGGFFLALGGQIGGSIGKHNGQVVRVTPDGADFQVIAAGLRQPYLGYNAETGLLTASDQQGNWKPATPIYRIEEGRYFGFQPERFKDKARHPSSIAPPEVWIPHFVNQSGAGQVWIKQQNGSAPRMGALNGALVHIGYERPELFKIYLDPDGAQGAVMPLLSGFPSGLLNGRVNPRDGLLYVTGFQIFGSSGSRTGGIYRVRPGGVPCWLPREIRAEKRGILMSFDTPLSVDLAAELGRYAADRWNYRQTHQYGSGNYRTDNDEPGQEAIPVSSAMLSMDGKSLFLGIRDMRPSHSLRLTYRLPAPGVEQVENAYLTVHSLPSLDLTRLGFKTNEVDLRPRLDLAAEGPAVEPAAELGREVALRHGCVACHATGDALLPPPPPVAEGAKTAVGPSWIGLWGAHLTFSNGAEIKSVDAAYLRESILDPARRVREGYEMERTGVGMPSYLGVLKDHEIESLVLYIQTLKK